jgi:hypothetical protein
VILGTFTTSKRIPPMAQATGWGYMRQDNPKPTRSLERRYFTGATSLYGGFNATAPEMTVLLNLVLLLFCRIATSLKEVYAPMSIASSPDLYPSNCFLPK